MLKSYIFLLVLLLGVSLPNYSLAQCTNVAYASPYPAALQSCPSNTGWNDITTCGYTGEYSQVSVVEGITYRFGSSNAADWITITKTDNTILAFALNQVDWKATFTGTVYFYTHDNDCGAAATCRTRRWQMISSPSEYAFGSNLWNVYAFNGGAYNATAFLDLNPANVTYRGFYTHNTFSISTSAVWASAASPSSAVGYLGCTVNNDQHVFVYKRQGFPCGRYSITNINHDDAIRIFIDGVQIYNTTTCCSSAIAWQGNLGPNSTIEVRIAENGGGSNLDLPITLVSAPYLITGATTVCVGSTTDLDVNEAAWTGLPTGGTITTSGNDRIHTFNSSGSFSSPQALSNARVLVVGGGGGGGSNGGGGGGAGGFYHNTAVNISSGATTVTVGAGGAVHNNLAAPNTSATNGGQSAFGALTAGGGGGGASRDNGLGGQNGGAGTAPGSGGGGGGSTGSPRYIPGSSTNSTGGAGTVPDYGCPSSGGGGGGAATAATRGTSTSWGTAGNGGTGIQNNISGANVYYAGGGGGGTTTYVGCGGSPTNGNNGTGGLGGGGNGESTAGAANTGGGGGAERAGGSGVVIVRYGLQSWVSSNTAVATVNQFTGVVTGVSSGTATITYTSATGCQSTTTVVVAQAPPTPTITPVSPVCAPANITASNSMALNPVGANLVAHYPFYDDLVDYSGSGLNLTQTSGAAPDYSQGGLNLTARSFQSATTGILNTDNHTISYYIKFTSVPAAAWEQIFAFTPAGTDRSPGLWRRPSENKIHWRYDGGNSGYDETVLPAYTANTWYHVVGVKQGSNFSFYVDGVLLATVTVTNPKAGGTSPLFFGQTAYAAASGAILRDFKVFNTSLSNSQVAGLGKVNWYSTSCNGTLVDWAPTTAVNPATPTTYYVNATNMCGTSACASILVNPPASATLTTASASICYGNTVALGGTVTASGAWTLTLSNGATTTGSGSGAWSINVTPTATTTYTISSLSSPCSTVSGSTTLTLPIAGTTIANNGESATCIVNAGETVRFYHSSGRYIATVTANGTSLGSTTATVYVDGTNQIVPACAVPTNIQFQTAVMQRHWLITPAVKTQPATVRLPYTNAEYTSLQTAAGTSGSTFDAVTGQASIKCSKYSNAGTPALENSTFTDNCGSGATTIWANSGTGTTNPAPGVAGVWYSDFTIPGFSEFWLHGSNNSSPLPIELTSFTATCNEMADAVTVEWTTASENNSSHFVIDRSFDGNNWDEIGSVAAAGNSTSPLNYSLLDDAAVVRSHEVIYYRMHQFDNDGVSKEYGPASAECKNSTIGMELFPNPASSLVNVVLHGDYDVTTFVVFTDMQGKEVRRVQYDEQAGKLYTVDIANLEPGVYIVRLMDGTTNKEFVRFVKR